MNPHSTTWELATPPGTGAVAIVQLRGDIDQALTACGIRPVGVGEVKVRDLMGIDRGVVARFSRDLCQLMPHGGLAVVRAILEQLTRRGIRESDRMEIDARAMYPEARSAVEARALAALARAASPLAVDLLLAQHVLWAEPGAASDPRRDLLLNRLIEPPLVVAVGASNIGKSTLVNALAGRGVSVVADESGTTRDHVGVMLDLAGLVVRYVDTPGIRDGADEVENEAVGMALHVASRADLVLHCSDPTTAPTAIPFGGGPRDVLQVGLRADLGPPPVSVDAAVSVVRGEGIAELVAMIRERLVPSAAIQEQRAWKFWPEG